MKQEQVCTKCFQLQEDKTTSLPPFTVFAKKLTIVTTLSSIQLPFEELMCVKDFLHWGCLMLDPRQGLYKQFCQLTFYFHIPLFACNTCKEYVSKFFVCTYFCTRIHNFLFSASSSGSLNFMSTLIQSIHLSLYGPLLPSSMPSLLVHSLLSFAYAQTISNVPLILSTMSATPHLLQISLFLIMSLLLVPSIHLNPTQQVLYFLTTCPTLHHTLVLVSLRSYAAYTSTFLAFSRSYIIPVISPFGPSHFDSVLFTALLLLRPPLLSLYPGT